jgi:dGTPase
VKPERFGPSVTPPAHLHEEAAPSRRSEAQRDRDRILYSSAFLRLGHITQVTAPEAGRVFHTRLTHSLKVAQVARRLAESFVKSNDKLIEVLDPDAVEAAALAHDLGHPPFGHIAEQELHRAAATAGGFEGNAQSFRIVTRLALRDGESEDGPYRGLNLSCRVLDALLKYPRVGEAEYHPGSQVPKLGAYYSERELLRKIRDATGHEPSDETQCPAAAIMDWADDITYAVHDVEDFFRAGVLPLWTLTPDSATLEEFLELHKRRYPDADEQATAAVIADLINPATSPYAVPDDGSSRAQAALSQASSNHIGRYVDATSIKDHDPVHPRIEIDRELRGEVDVLKSLVSYFVIEDAPLATVQHGQRRMIRELHEWHNELAADSKQWRHFPPRYREWLREAQDAPETDRHITRIVTDYIASATEEQATTLYRRMGGYSDSSPFDGVAR